MKDQNIKLSHKLSLIFLSFFGTGYSPKAPGTVGSLATIPLIILFSYLNFSFLTVAIITIVLFIAACLITEKIQKQLNIHDPGWIVMDEVIGMLITWLFIFPSITILDLSLVFIIFRVFDIFKIYPASWFDKKVNHGLGTIADDVISAFYAGLTLLGVKYFLTIL